MKKFHETFRDRIDPVDGTVIINERDFAAIQEDAQEAITVSNANLLLTGYALRLLRLILKRAINNAPRGIATSEEYAPRGIATSEELAEIQEVERLVIKPFETAKQKGQTKGAK